MTTLFIAGATGLVGGHALTLALADTRVTRVIAPTRRLIPPHPRLENPRLNELLDDARSDGWRADGAICALGATRAIAGSVAAFRAVDHDLVLAITRRLREAGVERFALVSSLGADPRSHFLYTRTKGEVEAAINSLAFPSLTILRPGFLDGERAESRPFEQMAGALLRFAGPLLPRSARVSSVPRVAALLIEAAITGAPGVHIIGSAQMA
ncbi:NAD(P)H-binding protein [Roseiarcaceae bacterium H3SJ34-1]|uniref:NAD(P)H-binding protein n=1 Tax=Terripilifer ovatus TaxID=3032367 RepID=UPI003AB93746|nr:NAD(P)H-binding protein [Roseiarcaceae bacterium H3SJ34-1]